MEPRLDAYKRVPGALPAMRGLENLVRESGLEAPLLELVRIRASQMNGCAYCLDMHSKDARAAGETEQRLDTLSAWRETAFFTDRERAALEWAERALSYRKDSFELASLAGDLRLKVLKKRIVAAGKAGDEAQAEALLRPRANE